MNDQNIRSKEIEILELRLEVSKLKSELSKVRYEAQANAINAFSLSMASVMNAPLRDLASDIRNQQEGVQPPAYIEVPAPVQYETPGHEFTKLVLRQAIYFLLLMLAVGVALAVFL